jgi:hypothetical protein
MKEIQRKIDAYLALLLEIGSTELTLFLLGLALLENTLWSENVRLGGNASVMHVRMWNMVGTPSRELQQSGILNQSYTRFT